MITNSPNPLKDLQSSSLFYGPTFLGYSDLPDESKIIIDKIISSLGCKIDLKKFNIQYLGYNVPGTKKFRMNITSTILKLTQEDGTEIVLVRNTPDLIETTCNGIKHSYVLPIEHTELLAVLFGTESLDILNNILGAIYADQEKGWTLLNRGKAIAGIRFNINELIRGLSDRNCDSIIRQLETVEESLQKYRQILSIAQYRESIAEKAESLIEEHYDKKRTLQIQQLTVERDQLKKEIRRLDENLSENKKAIDYIDGLKLMIRLPDGKEICLKRDMVVGATDSLDLLAAKRRFKARKLQSILKELDSLKEEKQEDDEQLSLFKVESLAETFDKDIINVPIDSVRVKSVIDGNYGPKRTPSRPIRNTVTAF